MKYFSQFIGLPRQVYVLCLVRLISGMGSLVFPFSSLILTGMVGLTTAQAGIAAMLYAASNVAGAVVGGRMADYYGRRRVYFYFTAITCAIFFIASFYCTTAAIVPLSIAAFFFGSGCYPIVSAMVADSAKGPKSAECFSLLYLSHNLGFAVGPALGGALLAEHLGLVYRLQSGMFMLGALILMVFTVDVYRAPAKGAAKEGISSEAGGALRTGTWKLMMQTKILAVFVATLALATTAYAALGFVLPLQFKSMYGLAAGGSYGGRIWTVNALAVVFGTPVLMRYTKTHHQFNCMAIGCLLYAAGFGAYGFLSRLPLYFAAALVWSAGEVLISTGAGVFIAEHSPASHIARFQSQYDMARSAGRGLGPLIFGAMLTGLSYRQVWVIDAAVCLAMSVFCFAVYRRCGAEPPRAKSAETAGIEEIAG